ncbi:FHA domain-containing protein, partial [Salmonella enterica]|uniref:FHA domain-containing protein n=1 Tax=Salmonella enterica TaxID=28901 RepID=UPI003D2C1969
MEFPTDCVVLGRGKECTLTLDDDACSRYHARIVESQGGYQITDLESTNGLRLNGKQVKQSALMEGDRFVVGRHVF